MDLLNTAMNLAANDRLWSTLGPVLVMTGALAAALVAHAVHAHRVGRFHDEEMDQRGLGGLFRRSTKHAFAWLMRPLWRGLVAARIAPNTITTVALCVALLAGVSVAYGRFALGGWLYMASGALDFLDGRVARAAHRETRGGAVLDSVVDRYGESALLVGLAWHYRGSATLLAALLALTGSLFVPYLRARGEAIGIVMKDVGFMQRAERVVVLGLGVALAPFVDVLFASPSGGPAYHLATAALWLLAVTSHVTALQRLSFLLRSVDERPAATPKAAAPPSLSISRVEPRAKAAT